MLEFGTANEGSAVIGYAVVVSMPNYYIFGIFLFLFLLFVSILFVFKLGEAK